MHKVKEKYEMMQVFVYISTSFLTFLSKIGNRTVLFMHYFVHFKGKNISFTLYLKINLLNLQAESDKYRN